ncbi:hypothetical protein ABZ920_02075 [Streptomyces sp. NPDC046831]|uniref:hypothetical protein n=1 Tax=Streptomyces sp. NPDC046831 TaxID=3154805 RepID=UPI0034024443
MDPMTWPTSLALPDQHIRRFREHSTHELGIQPEAYDPKLDVDFTQLRDQDLRVEGFGTAA